MSKKLEINSGRASPTQLEAPPLVADAELGQVLPPGAKAPERPGNYIKVRNLEDPPALTGKIYRKGMTVPVTTVASKEPAHIAINVAPPKKSCAVSGGFRKTNGSKKARKSKESRKSKKARKSRKTIK
jgi:hypothetical protein